MEHIHKVGIIGGGVSGVVIALELAKYGIDNILFEEKESVVNGPPFCHLHAGGNLYPDISIEQCKTLMKQSIEMARLFPESIDKRPTLISIPKTEKYEFNFIKERLDILVDYYKKLILDDPANEILGKPEEYYKIYTKEDVKELSKQNTVKTPQTPDQWITNTTKLIDYDLLKDPIILVQEYGWNLFRLGAHAQIALQNTNASSLQLKTRVQKIEDVSAKGLDYNWVVTTNTHTYKVKYLVNSCGYQTGSIDESLKLKVDRLVEFKAAYVSKWKPISGLIPELIFHGERGTPHGMAQLTPYCDDLYQIHGMTEDITLFKNGLVKSQNTKAQPEFDSDITEKLNHGWSEKENTTRTNLAIEYVANFVPSFKSATIGGPPLYGAQQIPGNDASLRVGEVSFPSNFYARSEIVKASSALTVAKQIIDKLQDLKIVERVETIDLENKIVSSISVDEIDKIAKEFATHRGYPGALSKLLIKD